MKQSTTSVVYLLHFQRKLGNPSNSRGMAQHYIGFAEHDLAARLERHRVGNGSRLMHAVAVAGIPWTLARTWEGGRDLERSLKSQKNAARLCPYCRGEVALPAARVIGKRVPMQPRPVQFYR
jgi:predicted GIY-YIG superfamily endonuclease